MNKSRKELTKLHKIMGNMMGQIAKVRQTVKGDGLVHTADTMDDLFDMTFEMSKHTFKLVEKIDDGEHLEEFGLNNMDADFSENIEDEIKYIFC